MLRRNKSKALQKAANLGTIDIYPFGTLQKLKTAKIVPNRIDEIVEFLQILNGFCGVELTTKQFGNYQ